MFCVHLIDVALCNVVKINLQHSIQRKVRIPQRGQIHEYSLELYSCILYSKLYSELNSEYSLGGVGFTHRVRDMMFET